MEPALYLIPAALGDTPLSRVLPDYNAGIIRDIRFFIVENLRSARRFLKEVDRDIDMEGLTFFDMGKHASPEAFATYLRPLEQGMAVGVISEAGCPAVADPGADVVAIAQRKGLRVIPLAGSSSVILALMASGLNGQSFAFNGYLPIDPAERSKRIKFLEQRAYAEHQTQLFIETPYRNARMFGDILRTCRPRTRLCVAAGITCKEEYIKTRTIQEWKKHPLPDLSKVPAIFLIYE